MSSNKDDWEKPRSHGQHLTEDEINVIRNAARKGASVRDVARQLKCSSRVVHKYYSQMGAQGGPDQPRQSAPKPSRFYRSSFEPT